MWSQFYAMKLSNTKISKPLNLVKELSRVTTVLIKGVKQQFAVIYSKNCGSIFQQRLTVYAMPKPTSSKKLMLLSKNKKIKLFDGRFRTTFRRPPEKKQLQNTILHEHLSNAFKELFSPDRQRNTQSEHLATRHGRWYKTYSTSSSDNKLTTLSASVPPINVHTSKN